MDCASLPMERSSSTGKAGVFASNIIVQSICYIVLMEDKHTN